MPYCKRVGQINIAGFAVVLLPFLYLAVHLFIIGVPDLPTGGDGALLEMSTRDVFSRQILLGPYSRFLFFHPGPLYFILRYPVYMLMGQRSSSVLITTIMVVIGSIFGIWKTSVKFTTKSSGLVVTLLFGLFFLVMDKTLWLSEWNPYIIMFPILFFIVSSAAFAAGNSRYFFICVLTGSLVAQTHLGGIPLLAFVFLTAVVFLACPWLIRKGNRESSNFKWRNVLLGLTLLLLLWAPPLYEQLSSEKGNLTKIQEFFEDNDPEIHAAQGLLHWSNAITRFEIESFAHSRRNSGTNNDGSLGVVALRILLLSVCYGVLRKRGLNPYLCALNLLLIVAHAATLYSVTQIRGPVNAYLIEWMSVLAPLSYSVILISLVLYVKNHIPKSVKLHGICGVFLITVVFSYFVTRDVRGYLCSGIDPSWTNELAIESLSRDLAVLMTQDPDSYYVLKLQTWDCWAVMTGIMNCLEKQGFNIVMSDNVWFKETPVPLGYESRILHIGFLNDRSGTQPYLAARYNNIGILIQ